MFSLKSERAHLRAAAPLPRTYGKIAGEEGVSERRVHQIVSYALRRQDVDNASDHGGFDFVPPDFDFLFRAVSISFMMLWK